jgi:hypothetical protein
MSWLGELVAFRAVLRSMEPVPNPGSSFDEGDQVPVLLPTQSTSSDESQFLLVSDNLVTTNTENNRH